MVEEGLIGWQEIHHMWGVIPHSDLRGRAILERIIGEISSKFKPTYTEALIDCLLSVK
jgi:hypothetical protein